jgi:hypothetical protein
MQAVAVVEHILVAAELAQVQQAEERAAVVPREHVVQIPITPEVLVLLAQMDSVAAAAADLYIQDEQMTRSVVMVDLV